MFTESYPVKNTWDCNLNDLGQRDLSFHPVSIISQIVAIEVRETYPVCMLGTDRKIPKL